MEILVGIGVFLLTIIFIEAVFRFYRNIRNPDREGIRKRLKSFSMDQDEQTFDILRRHSFSDVPWLHTILARSPKFHRLNRAIEQAGAQYTVGFFLLLIILFALTGYVAGMFLRLNALAVAWCRALVGLCPDYLSSPPKEAEIGKV